MKVLSFHFTEMRFIGNVFVKISVAAGKSGFAFNPYMLGVVYLIH
jgi:hypothetical protein